MSSDGQHAKHKICLTSECHAASVASLTTAQGHTPAHPHIIGQYRQEALHGVSEKKPRSVSHYKTSPPQEMGSSRDLIIRKTLSS